jgi:hypothetical protein
VVAILVMHREQVPVGRIKFSAAPRANESMNTQRPFPVILTSRATILQFQFSYDIFR